MSKSKFEYKSFPEIPEPSIFTNEKKPSPEPEPSNISRDSPYLHFGHRNKYGMFSPVNIVKNLTNKAPWDATTSMRRQIREDREQYNKQEEECYRVKYKQA